MFSSVFLIVAGSISSSKSGCLYLLFWLSPKAKLLLGEDWSSSLL